MFGHVVRWTGSPAVDSALTILSVGAIALATTVLAARVSGGEPPAQSAGLDVLVDGGLVWVACYAAYRLWFGNGDTLRENFPSFLRSCPFVVASQMLALLLAGVYRGDGRRSSRETVFALGAAVVAQQLLLQCAILFFWSQTRAYSRGAVLIGGVVAFGLLAAWRAVISCAGAAPSWWQWVRARHRHAIALAALCALTGVAWGAVVPPFEAPDEIYFCRIAVDVAQGQPPPYDPMFFRLVEPLVRVTFNAGLRFDAARNPAFRFVSNQPGRVTMFRQGPGAGVGRRELAALYLMRGVVLGLTIATTLLIYTSSFAFFGQSDMALLVAGLSFLVPQFSFAGSQVNPESLATLWGAAAAALVIGRATRTLSPVVAWALLIPLLGTAPFTDSTAVFLVPLAPVAMALVERGWKRRLTMLAGVVALGVFTLWVGHAFADSLPEGVPHKVRDLLAGADLGALSGAAHPLTPFLRQADTGRYLLYEFVPKMFFGFWGWLGQPSILLPAAFYAAVFGLMVASAIGLARLVYSRVRRPAGLLVNGEPSAFLVVAGIGVVTMLIPIVYSTVLWNRNEWYGRWLFPWLGPIMILITVGIRELWRVAAKRPRVLSVPLAIVFAVVGVAWLGGFGTGITAGVRANHYGDQDHLLRTIRYSVLTLGLLPVWIELIACVRNRQFAGSILRQNSVRPGVPVIILCSAWAINLVLLFAFVRPLYRPLDGSGYAKVIRAELAQRDFPRAIAIADVAMRELPNSDDLARVVPDVMDVIAATGQYDALAAYLGSRTTVSGTALTSREALAMARAIRASSGDARDTLLSIAKTLVPNAGTEELQILALELMSETAIAERTIPLAAKDRAKPIGLDSRGVRLEAFSTRTLPSGDREVIIYFRPLAEWRGRRLWLHAYPAGSQVYADVKAAPQAFEGWRKGELSWEAFRTPGSGPFNVYIGISLADDLGKAYPIGPI